MPKPRNGKPKLASCSPDDVFGAVRKLGGFDISLDGSKHTKITHITTGYAFAIPRHAYLNRGLMKDCVEDFLVGKCGFLEKEVYRHL